MPNTKCFKTENPQTTVTTLQNLKTAFSGTKTEKTDLKNSQNHKTENPIPPQLPDRRLRQLFLQRKVQQ